MKCLSCLLFALLFAVAPATGQKSAEPPQGKALRGFEGVALCVSMTPDGKALAVGLRDKTVQLWDPAARKELKSFTGHTAPVLAIAVSAKGDLIVSGSSDQTVRVWDVAEGRERLPALKGHGDAVTAVAVSPDGQFLASGGWDGTVRLWSAAGKEERSHPAEQGPIFSVAFSTDGKWLSSGGRDGSVKTWSVTTSKEGVVLQVDKKAEKSPQGRTVYALAWSPDGQTLAAGFGSEIKLWSIDGRQEKQTLKGHIGAVRGLAFAAAGKQLISVSEDRTVKVWKLDEKGAPLTLPGGDGPLYSVAASADGRRIAAAGTDANASVRVWTLGKE